MINNENHTFVEQTPFYLEQVNEVAEIIATAGIAVLVVAGIATGIHNLRSRSKTSL